VVVQSFVTAVLVLMRGDVELTRWPLQALASPDLALVDQLARLQLGARRVGCTVVLRDACPMLLGLLDLVGLRVEVGGQPEGGEEVGVEEVVQADDPVA
jgi:hypothetical protein